MILVVCPACGRRKLREKVLRGKVKCSNCGALAVKCHRKIRAWMRTDDYDGTPRQLAQLLTYKGLTWWAEEKGFGAGWASMKYRKLFGIRPANVTVNPLVPSQELLAWCIREGARFLATMRKREKDHEHDSHHTDADA